MFWLIAGLLLLTLFLSYVMYMSKTHGLFREMGVAGPKPWLVVGNFVQEMLSDGIINYHIKMYNHYKNHKVFGIFRGRDPYMVVRDLDMIRDICVKHFNDFPNRMEFFDEAPMSHALTEAKGDHWKNIRKTVSPTFNTSRLRLMEVHIETNTRTLLQFLKEKSERNEPMELKELFSRYTMDVIASTGYGMQTDCISNKDSPFMKHSSVLLQSLGRIFIFKYFLFFIRPLLSIFGVTGIPKSALDFFTRFVDATIDIRKNASDGSKTKHDFINLLLDAQADGSSVVNDNMSEEEAEILKSSGEMRGLSLPDIQAQAILFMLAGFETVASAMSFTLFLLALHPECLQKVQQEIDEVLEGKFPNYDSVQKLEYLEMCLSEAMRAYNPTFINDRTCVNDCDIGGVRIPAGLKIMIPLCAIHRDPDLWPEPEEFIPERFTPENKANRHPYAYMPFGHGPRKCVGMRLAQLELKISVCAVLQSFTPVTCSQTVYPVRIDKFRMGAKDGLWVRLNAR